MEEWKIYHKDGTPLTDANGKAIVVKDLEYNGEWMGACNISVDITNEAPVKFTIGDYIDYRDERFEINYDPGKIKSAPQDEKGDGFKYSGVVFNSYIDELVRSEFLDIVLNDNEAHYTSLPKFIFYVSSLDDIADRLQANMNDIYGGGSWHFYTRDKSKSITDRGCDEALWEKVYGDNVTAKAIESTSLSISSQTCWDVLGLVNSQFDVNFIVRGRNVFIETAGFTAEHIFKYGKGNGLYEIEETADSSQAVITRMRAYGNTTNMPTRYYAEVGARCMADIKEIKSKSEELLFCNLVLDFDSHNVTSSAFTTRREYIVQGSGQTTPTVCEGDFVVKVTYDDITTVTGYVSTTSSGETTFYSEYKGTQTDTGDEPSKENLIKFISGLTVGTRLYFVDGAKRSKFPSKNIAYTSDLPNNMAIDRLMLPGFPNESLQTWWTRQTNDTKARLNPTGAAIRFSTDQYRPYVESPNIDKVGIRPASVFFDTDDDKNGLKDIYPTIEGMIIDNERVDVIDTGSKETVTDNGVYKDGQTVPNFDIYLKKEIDFDIKTLANDDFQINMKDGMCGGRSFKVAAVTKEEDGRWKLRLERTLDNDLKLYFPYSSFPINSGDHFVLTGLDMPESYVSHNSEELLRYAIAKLLDNDYTRKVYTPKVDEIFMARQNDEAEADKTGTIKSIYKTMKEGDLIHFKDEDLQIDKSVTIEKLTIKEKDGKLPTFDITLKEDKEVGTIQKIQNQISSIVDGASGAGGYTNAQIEGMVASVGQNYFLSKLKKDKAYGVIDFLKGVLVNSEYSINEFGDAFLRSLQGKGFSVSELGEAILKTLRSADYDTAAQAGFGLTTRTDGKYKLSLTDLEVWGKAIFHELEIRKLSYSGGNYIFSPAGSTLMHVKEVRNNSGVLKGWDCFFLADDGETATENLWKVGDLARCQSFNIKSGVYENVANKYYWREVVSVSKENKQITDDDGNVLYDGKKFGRVSLSATIYDTGGTDVPAAGDTIVCLGNRTLTERRNAIIISTVGEEAPSFVQYSGIDDFTLQGKDVTVLSPKGNRLTGSFYSSAVSGELGSVLKQTMEGLTSEVSKRESEISSVRSEIKQSADALSLKVEQTAEKDRNLLPNSYFQIGSDIWGVCRRKVMLEKGKSYALTVWGKIDSKMSITTANGLIKIVPNTHKMRAHIWTADTSGTWTYDQYAEIGADNETGYATVKFNDVPSTGEYSFAIFPDVEINETNGEYMFYATCAQIEEIPSIKANGTAWSLGKKDPAIYGNLLPRLGGWTFGKNCALRPNEAEVEGHRLDVAGGANQSDEAGLDIIRLDGIELASGETYTLSFWAKGKESFQTYLFNGDIRVCSYAVRDDGESSGLKDGSIEPQRTLTMEWTRYSVTFSIKTSGAANIIPVRLAKGGSVNICGVKLEPFGRLTDFTDQNVTVEELEATGIDIKNKKITATADTFEVKNNKGATTAKVNADGVFETNDIVCNGGTFKKINATDMTATGGTFTNITATDGTYKNIQVTENSWMNSGKFCGEKQTDGTILGGFTIGDQGLVYDIPQEWFGTTKGASSNIAIKGANGNLSSKLGVIFDSNYLMGLELKVKYNSTDTPWGSYNVAAWLEASGNPQGQNYGFMGVGHGILRGMIEGTNFKQINLNTSSYGALSLSDDGNRWLFFPSVDASAYLPTKSSVAKFLGDTTAWSIRVMAICSPLSNHTITIRGRQTSGSYAEETMPQLYNYGRNTVAGIDVPPGKIVEILLVWDGTNYYAMHIKNNS